jgi:predicted SAM-dependent methyltransferase
MSGTRDRQVADHARLCEEYAKKLQDLKIDKAHYGSGSPPSGRVFGDGWVNIDLGGAAFADPTTAYVPVDLASKHPFPSGYFRFSFAEDFLEHLDQSQSMIFLSEAFRTLRQRGVLRLSFPGLRGVLRRHYRSSDYEGASVGQEEAYTMWGHKHFYCEESLLIVARHLGFSNVEYVEYGKSKYKDLADLDSRLDQRDLNIYAELTK